MVDGSEPEGPDLNSAKFEISAELLPQAKDGVDIDEEDPLVSI
eukprot:CAMPEP_0170487008 /NCGR_PEP_ID=MMETSP0208-20121228/5880_1 /TAXON_ID=197538 /ORGANISM="Strombidium inclinatum, Strain S3" /LENGTH=42 /DNA_ID= /DNA_START= /DNA_END= /DNA_ORIENTATION=